MRQPPWHMLSVGLLTALSVVSSISAQADGSDRPHLVLFVVVDQLRGDMPHRFERRFGPDGLRYLMNRGTYYTQAFYRHSTTFTAVGHATLATGADTAQHGIAANDWYDAQRRQPVYCVEDSRHRLIGKRSVAHQGTSPRNLTARTVGDELVLASDGKSRVYSVSVKDRGAIIPGGHLGKAFWYDPSCGEFATSTFYYEEYPNWVTKWNAKRLADRFRDTGWTLLHAKKTYKLAERDDRPFERSYRELGRTFPHPLQNEDDAAYYSTLRYTPMSDELTVDFALEMLAQEKLGQSSSTDMLCVSLSATDYVGHAFGPGSLEAEDNLLRLDRSLARLFAAVDASVGLDNTLVMLSSDHGVGAVPEHLQSLGLSSGRLSPKKLLNDLNEYLSQHYETDQKLVAASAIPNIYLDLAVIEELKLNVAEVERLVADEILRQKGYSYALTRTELLKFATAKDPIVAKVQHAFHPRRSGNLMVVQQASWYLYNDPGAYSAMHGSPYPYDTHVPVFFAGSGIESQRVERQIGPQDIAPTISALLGIAAPASSTGKALVEVLD